MCAMALATCGKKGPPLAPLVIVPAPVSDLSATRFGDRVTLHFTPPDKNMDNSTPADVEHIDVYALSVADALEAPEAGVVVQEGTKIGTIDMTKPAATNAEQPSGPRTFRETLSAGALEVWRPNRKKGSSGSSGSSGSAGSAGSSGSSGSAEGEKRTEVVPVRLYAVVPVSRKDRRGAATLATVPIVPPPPPPASPVLTYSAKAVSLVWVGAETTSVYNVYPVRPADDATSPSSDPGKPLNESPLKVPSYEHIVVEFGKAQCFSVTSVKIVAQRRIESVLSAPACVTPVDTFPPAVPTGLAAVAGPGSMSLIWDAVDAGDLAGYVVLRGVAGGDTLQPLTPEPIKETTFKDATVTPGTRYVYAVVAVDTAKNRSAEARVEETAR